MAINFNAAANINTGNLGDDPFLVERCSTALRKCRNFGKAWDVGDQATVFYPFKWYPTGEGGEGAFKLHSSAYYGHQISDLSVLGTTFLRSLSPIDANSQVIGEGDLAYQFSKISRLLVEARKEHDLANLNKKNWELLGDAAYQAARKAVEDKYDRNNMKAMRPLVGPLTMYRVTEVVYIAMDPNRGAPILVDERKQRTGLYIQAISSARLTKLQTLANDPVMGIRAQNPGTEFVPGQVYFLEVIYNFTSATNSKTEAGRTDPQGVAQPISIRTRYPDTCNDIAELQTRVPTTADGIAGQTYGMSPMNEEELRTKLQRYLFEYTGDFPYMSAENKDRLVKNAKLLDFLRVKPSEDVDLCQRIEAELGHPIGEAAAANAPTLSSIMRGDTPDFTQQSEVNMDRAEGDVGIFDPSADDVDLSGLV